MSIADDFSFIDGDIREVGGSANYSVLELHRWLQGGADDEAPATSDDLISKLTKNPSKKDTEQILNLLNGVNIDDAVARRLYDGSVIQDGGAEIYDPVTIYAPAGMRLEIIQNGALISPNFWTTGINADSANGISHRFLVKVRTGGADIDGRRLIGITREFGYSYGEFKINGTVRGGNVMAFTTWGADLNNATLEATVATWTEPTDFENTAVGFSSYDVNNDGIDEDYYSAWDIKSGHSINDFYEYQKYLTRRGSGATLYGLPGYLFRGITHEITVDNPSVTDFEAVEAVSWSGGTGQMIAINNVSSPTKMWIQLLTGVAPTDGQTITGATSTATCDVDLTVTEKNISLPYLGQSTGSAIIGGFGFGVLPVDLTTADKLFDLNGAGPFTPPNYVTVYVSNVVVGDSILLCPDDGAGFVDFDQLSVDGPVTGGSVGTITIQEAAIPADTPASGTIRILRANGITTRHAYDSWTGKVFTLSASTDFSINGIDDGADLVVTYLDKTVDTVPEEVTYIYSGSDRSLFLSVRNGSSGNEIQPYEPVVTVGSSGATLSVIRNDD